MDNQFDRATKEELYTWKDYSVCTTYKTFCCAEEVTGEYKMNEEYCPQCGEPIEQFYEGYCFHCCENNQRHLDHHNASFDAWQKLTDIEREERIWSKC